MLYQLSYLATRSREKRAREVHNYTKHPQWTRLSGTISRDNSARRSTLCNDNIERVRNRTENARMPRYAPKVSPPQQMFLQGWGAMNRPAATQILQRIRSEYLEMPGLSLRPEQVQRLCGVGSVDCQSVLEALVESGFLSKRPDGSYGRFSNPDISRARQAKAAPESPGSAARARNRLRAS
jgi:hypothetical protein